MTDDPLGDAGEYVLGTLDPAERAAFATRLLADPAARAAVEAWRARLEPLLTGAPEIAPPAAAWAGIAERTGAGRSARVAPAWRTVAIAASLLAAAGGAFALRPRETTFAPPGVSYVAAVAASGSAPALLVTIDPARRRAVVHAVALTPPARKSLELWYIGPGRDPRSMGLVSGDTHAAMPLAPVMVAGDPLAAGMFAVSVEPEGGAPGGAPTGEILYTGRPLAIGGT